MITIERREARISLGSLSQIYSISVDRSQAVVSECSGAVNDYDSQHQPLFYKPPRIPPSTETDRDIFEGLIQVKSIELRHEHC
jgi:hypothetical protein